MDNIYLIQLKMINMGNFKFTKTDIEGMFVVEPAVYGDNRGYFMETYNEKDFKDAGYDLTFVQDNQSQSFKGVLRGLHLQLKYPQGKLVRVIKGEVFDVGVDLRACLLYTSATGTITVKINNKTYVVNVTGDVTEIAIDPLEKGVVMITTTYSGDNKYASCLLYTSRCV